MADNTITLQFLTLADIKAQARVEPDFHEDDNYLLALGKAAERTIFKFLCRSYDEIVADEGEWPQDLTLAAWLLTSHWYKHREPAESAQMYVIPYAFDMLCMPYRKGTYSSVEDSV